MNTPCTLRSLKIDIAGNWTARELALDIRDDGTAERLLGKPAVEALAAAGEQIVSPDAKCPFAGARLTLPSASELGRLATARTDFLPGERLEPIYLREPHITMPNRGIGTLADKKDSG